jgi:hypothetical protein
MFNANVQRSTFNVLSVLAVQYWVALGVACGACGLALPNMAVRGAWRRGAVARGAAAAAAAKCEMCGLGLGTGTCGTAATADPGLQLQGQGLGGGLGERVCGGMRYSHSASHACPGHYLRCIAIVRAPAAHCTSSCRIAREHHPASSPP